MKNNVTDLNKKILLQIFETELTAIESHYNVMLEIAPIMSDEDKKTIRERLKALGCLL